MNRLKVRCLDSVAELVTSQVSPLAVWDTSRVNHGRSPTGRVPMSSSASLWLSTKSAFSARAAAVCAEPLTSTPYSSELELSWLGNREGELATTNGTPYMGVRREVLRGVHQIQLAVWGRCEPPSGVRGGAPEDFEINAFQRLRTPVSLSFLSQCCYKNPCYFLHT